jgi:glucosamine-6-phosphate deaminase
MSLLEIQGTAREHIPTFIYDTPEEASKVIAEEIAALIKERQKKGKEAILGLTTRNTPKLVYAELVRMHKEEGLSFRNVVSFNLDEFYPIEPDTPQSYHKYMNDHLFDHVDIPRKNINILDGTIPLDQIEAHCQIFEDKIKRYGGIDIQILGTGRSGHIGFNEPGSSSQSKTRLSKLDPLTISDNAEDFIKAEYVPLRALTMGINTIMLSKRIILMAWGERKADIIKSIVEGNVTDELPASYLQEHDNVDVVVDKWAALNLTRVKYPWLVRVCKWDEKLTKRAVIWLSQRLKKPILRLIDEDYTDNHLGELLMYYGSYYELNKWVFSSLRNTITGWPGGKPNADDTNRPTRATPVKKRVVLFSPHPDDDVISMGGTFLRLVEQGHEVHVAYQTSGNIAVTDDDARRFAEFSKDLCENLKDSGCEMTNMYKEIESFLAKKKLGDPDIPSVRLIKGLIRKGEAAAASRFFGLPDEQIHFLNLPFYETGTIEKSPVGEADYKIIMNLLNDVKPHQVYAAGDLRDPHGTHRVCLDAIFESLRRLKAAEEWTKDCWLWLYRGAWHEWEIEEIEMAVPISPLELLKKRKAIFKHQSQKDDVVFQGSDKREFWERAEDRNRLTASLYDQLGLIEYEAMEAFVRYHY